MVKKTPSYLLDSYWNRESKIKIHRKNGPAYYLDNNLHIEYFENGLNHRLDGPALLSKDKYNNITNINYINGRLLWPKEFAEETSHLICEYCKEFCKQKCFVRIP